MKLASLYFSVIILIGVSSADAVPATFLSPNQIVMAPFSITEPGLYILTDGVNYSTIGGTAITIATDDVTLDLNGKSLVSSAMNTVGIELSNSFTNITVKKGSLCSFDEAGIRIPAGTSDFFCEDMSIIGNETGIGLHLEGTSGSATRTSGVRIKNCSVRSFLDCINATATDALSIHNTQLNHSRFGILATDCNNWFLNTVQSSFHSVAAANRSIDAFSCNGWFIRNSEFNGNRSTANTEAVRFDVSGAGPNLSGAHIIENCTVSDNQSTSNQTGAAFISTDSCVIKNSSVDNNMAGELGGSSVGLLFGLRITGSAYLIENCSINNNVGDRGCNACFITSGTGCLLKNCTASFNLSSRAVNSFRPDGTGHILEQCVAVGNRSLGGLGANGFITLGLGNILFKNCTAASNGTTGFQNSSPAGSNLFIGNISFGHGSSNYVGGIPFLSVATTGPYPLAGSFDTRNLANLSFV